jgi:hypothetical protein
MKSLFNYMRGAYIAKSGGCIGFTVLVAILCGLFGSTDIPRIDSRIYIGMGVMAIISIFLRGGWTVPFMLAGVCFGTLVDGGIKSGDPESILWDSVFTYIAYTFIGLIVGVIIDLANIGTAKPTISNEQIQETNLPNQHTDDK